MTAPSNSRNAVHLELAAETLLQSSEVRFVARGTSMLPAIVPGDCLTIKSFSPCEVPTYGEALLVRRDGEFRIHRLVRVLDNTPQHIYILRGDALLQDDPPVLRSQILGRVTLLQRGGKSFPVAATGTLHQRLLRFFVRRSSAAAALLIRWHELRAGQSLRQPPSSAASFDSTMESA
jgi:Peptidase S24-like